MLTRRRMLQGSGASLAVAALSACGGGGSGSPSAQSPAAQLAENVAAAKSAGWPTATLAHPTASDIASMRTTPADFLSAYNDLGTSVSNTPEAVIRAAFGSSFASLNSSGCLTLFAAVTASQVATLGDTPLAPMDATLLQLLGSTSLACGHYCKLTLLLATLEYPTILPPDAAAGSPPKPTIHFLVWLDSAPINVGYHAQLIVTNVLDNAYLLLDPTYGIAMSLPYDAGIPNASLTVIENATTLLESPAAAGALVVFNANSLSQGPQLATVMASGEMSPAFIYHDSIYGSEGWDTRMSEVVPGVG
jgi:hypothetical protein